MRTIDRAIGRWSGILHALNVNSGVLSGKHQACPICGNGKDTFRFDLRSEFGKWYCNYCGGGLGLDFIKGYFRVENREALNMIDKVIGKGIEPVKIERRDPRPLLRSIWRKLRPASDEVVNYLRSRGLKPLPSIYQATLEYWHDGKSYGEFECMVCKIFNINKEFQSFHITYLKDGRKADLPVDKKVMSPIDTISGASIQLMKPNNTLGIAEGIETALSCYEMFDLPMWASISAGGMEKIEIPESVENVILFADNDDSYTGQASAYLTAKRLKAQGFNAYVQIAKNGDFNDDLMKGDRR